MTHYHLTRFGGGDDDHVDVLDEDEAHVGVLGEDDAHGVELGSPHGFHGHDCGGVTLERSEEHTSELQSPLIISYAVFCLKKF